MFLFFAVKAELFLIFPYSEAGHVLKMLLFFVKFEPQHYYKQGSFKKKACTTRAPTETQIHKHAYKRFLRSLMHGGQSSFDPEKARSGNGESGGFLAIYPTFQNPWNFKGLLSLNY